MSTLSQALLSIYNTSFKSDRALHGGLKYGGGLQTFDRPGNAIVKDNNGTYIEVGEDVPRIEGARYVRPELIITDTSNLGGISSVTAEDGYPDPFGGNSAIRITTLSAVWLHYNQLTKLNKAVHRRSSIWIRRVSGAGQLALDNQSVAAGIPIDSSLESYEWHRYATDIRDIDVGVISLNPSQGAGEVWDNLVFDIAFGMSERVEGNINTAPSEFIASGIDTPKFTENLSTVDPVTHRVTEDYTSKSINPAGQLIEATATNTLTAPTINPDGTWTLDVSKDGIVITHLGTENDATMTAVNDYDALKEVGLSELTHTVYEVYGGSSVACVVTISKQNTIGNTILSIWAQANTTNNLFGLSGQANNTIPQSTGYVRTSATQAATGGESFVILVSAGETIRFILPSSITVSDNNFIDSSIVPNDSITPTIRENELAEYDASLIFDDLSAVNDVTFYTEVSLYDNHQLRSTVVRLFDVHSDDLQESLECNMLGNGDIRIVKTTSFTQYIGIAAGVATDGTYKIACRYSSTTGMDLAINGTIIVAAHNANTSPVNLAAGLNTIGPVVGSDGIGGRHATMRFDDFQIFNSALSDDRMERLTA